MAPTAVSPCAAPITPTDVRDYMVADGRDVMAITGIAFGRLARNQPARRLTVWRSTLQILHAHWQTREVTTRTARAAATASP